MLDQTRHYTPEEIALIVADPPPPAPVINYTVDQEGRKHWRTGPGLPVPDAKSLRPMKSLHWHALHPDAGNLGGWTERNERRARLYCEWLANRGGLTIPADCRAIVEIDYLPHAPGEKLIKRIRAVRFERGGTPDRPSHGYYNPVSRGPRGGRIVGKLTYMENPDYTAPEIVATVTIPNWDHVPTVTACHD